MNESALVRIARRAARLRFLLPVFVFVLGPLASTADADDSAAKPQRVVVDVPEAVGPDFPTEANAEGTPEQLCKAAAAAPWSRELLRNHTECEWRALSDPSLIELKVFYDGGMRLYLARKLAAERLRIVSLLEGAESGPTQGADARVLRILRPVSRPGHHALAIETLVEWGDNDANSAYGYSSRRLMVCVADDAADLTNLKCTLQLPIHHDTWSGETEKETDFAATDGVRITSRASAEAVVAFRADCSVTWTLKRGSWEFLQGRELSEEDRAKLPKTKRVILPYYAASTGPAP